MQAHSLAALCIRHISKWLWFLKIIVQEAGKDSFVKQRCYAGNFLLAREGDFSTVKAIDFGLAVPFRVSDLPLEDLGLEGTAWYMAPEVLSSKVGPKSDVWSAGIMAAQLLTGRLPFDDFRSPMRPAITKIWWAFPLRNSCWYLWMPAMKHMLNVTKQGAT